MDLSRYQAQCPVPTCENHNDEELDIYCNTCKTPICLSCTKVDSDHANHEYDKIARIVRSFSHEISTTLNEKTRNVLSKLRVDLEINKRTEEINDLNLAKSISRINGQKETLQSFVHDLANEMINTLKTRNGENQQYVKTAITELTEQITEIEGAFNFFQESSQTLSNYNLLRLKTDYEEKLNEYEGDRYTSTQNGNFYVEGEIHEDELSPMLGTLIQNDPSKVKATEKGGFTHCEENIKCVIPVSCENWWITPVDSRKIHLVNKHGSVVEEKKINDWCTVMDVSEDGNMFYTCYGRSVINKVHPNGHISTFLNTKPLKPLAISFALDGDILVSLADDQKFEIYEDSRRLVQIMSRNGEVKQSYEFEPGSTKRHFVCPKRVRQNYNGDICAIDVTGKTTGRLCILGVDGRMKVVYDGQNLRKKFLPKDVCFDITSNIIISDMNNHSVHLLDPMGMFVKFLIVNESLRYPLSLGLHRSTLWIGCDSGEVKVFEYEYV